MEHIETEVLMRASVTAVLAASLSAIAATVAVAADKSSKPRIAVLEFRNSAGSVPRLDVADLRWTGTQPAAGGWAKADGLAVSWDVAESPDADGNGAADALTDGLLILRYSQEPQAAKISKVEALPIKQKVSEAPVARGNDRLRTAGPRDGWPATGADETLTVGGNRTESAVTGNTKWKNIVLKRGVDAAPAPGGVAIAAGDVTGDGVSAASGQATGKRQHMPVRIRTYAMPLQSGAVLIALARPWPACAVGDRFDGAYLVVGTTHRYQLQDATVVGCAANAVAINYRGAKAQQR
jgi:hypothetical protein